MGQNLLSNLGYAHADEDVPFGTRDGHGGHGREHIAQMERIANEISDKKLKAAIPAIYQ